MVSKMSTNCTKPWLVPSSLRHRGETLPVGGTKARTPQSTSGPLRQNWHWPTQVKSLTQESQTEQSRAGGLGTGLGSLTRNWPRAGKTTFGAMSWWTRSTKPNSNSSPSSSQCSKECHKALSPSSPPSRGDWDSPGRWNRSLRGRWLLIWCRSIKWHCVDAMRCVSCIDKLNWMSISRLNIVIISLILEAAVKRSQLRRVILPHFY